MKSKVIWLLPILLGFTLSVKAQNNREFDDNQIGWHAFFLNYKLNDRFSLHGEFQWRRDNFVSENKQNLYRSGLNIKLHPQATFRVGYAFADTWPYGDTPIQSNGIRFPEHRSYQMMTLNNPVGRFNLSHRFMLEQRWVGRNMDPSATKANDFVYLNRFRYMFRADIPLKGNTLENNEPYLALYDEVLLGFGENVNQNVFDQNRLGILLGYRFSPQVRIEAGYLQQILQFGRFVNGRNYFQNNQGFIINTFINLQ